MKNLTVTNKWFKVSETLKTITGFAAVAVLSLLTTACGNNGGGNSPVGISPFAYGAGFAGGAGVGGMPIAQGIGQTTYYGTPNYQLSLTFYGSSMASPIAGSYSGQVAATGQLLVSVPMQCGGYGGITIQPGVYTVQTQQPGIWQGESFGNLYLIGTGATQLSIALSNDWINNQRIQGSIVVTSPMGSCSDTLF